ncbi:TPR-like protein [Rhizoctonia solani]|uniref:TPR-like protein n=1 Tax=Rhizoctonia solani TaxID=456999 RepID=A0A8H7LKZ1_9AGAM|nr:TPR-like protein [Rhizoctonia solani]
MEDFGINNNEGTATNALSNDTRLGSASKGCGSDIRRSIEDLSHEELYDLGKSYLDRLGRLGELGDMGKAMKYAKHTFSSTPDGHPDLQTRLAQLGACYSDRFKRLGELNDMEKAVDCSIRALELTPGATPDQHSNLSGLCADLGASYINRYRRLGEASDSDKAIEYMNSALSFTPNDHPDLPRRHSNLGASYGDRYRRLGKPNDLEESMKWITRAVELAPKDCSYLPALIANLGGTYNSRYRRLGELDILEKAIEHRLCALELTPNGHPDLPVRHGLWRDKILKISISVKDIFFHDANLGLSYRDKYRHLAGIGDLNKAIKSHSSALKLTPNNHPDLPDRYSNLGMSYYDRYHRLGKFCDLEKSIKCDHHALLLTPGNHPDFSRRQADMGVSYSAPYRRTGKLDALEKAIEYHSRAVALTPNCHPHSSARHTNLGAAHGDRYKRLGELANLDKSIGHALYTLTFTPDSHPDLPLRYGNLGVAYLTWYSRLREPADIQTSIEHMTSALLLTPEDHSNLSYWYTTLGVSYSDQYDSLGESADFKKAIEHLSHALGLTPNGHTDLRHRYAALGVAYRSQYRHIGEWVSLEKAIEYDDIALTLTPEGHPGLSLRHFCWATNYRLAYQHTSDPSYLNTSMDLFREASRLPNSAPRELFNYAVIWARFARTFGHLSCIEAFRVTIDFLPQFIWLGATTSQRYYDLSLAEGLPVIAGCAAIRASEGSLALEWLEHTRCVVWSQSLMLRSPLDDLKSSYPYLGNQLQEAAKRLRYASSDSPHMRNISEANTLELRQHLARQYDELLAQVRNQAGFKNFLRPAKSDVLLHAARYGPIAVINCFEVHCDALLLIPGCEDIIHIPLPDFTGVKAHKFRSEMEKSIRSRRSNERGVERRPVKEEEVDFQSALSDLWYNIVKPILDFLGYTNNPGIATENMPHITWCPTGILSFLPLHAAGDYEQPGSRAFDYVISSYTPTLTALLNTTTSTLRRNSRVLIIGQEATPGHQQLPGTIKELEYIVGHMKGRVNHSKLSGSQATTMTVLNAMEQHDWVHLACHAHQSVQDPTESGFFLHDGLAFLSACQTATGDETLPDEAIHLASGMLMAGYRSVIATMWSVVDDDAPFVADEVYARLIRDGKIDNGEVGKALHYAVAELRDKIGEKEFNRWVPYIHVGS